MKAWVLHGINNLTYDEVAMPTPGDGEVLVQVKAAGICGSDIPRIFKTGAHKHPLIPGHEFSGQVVSVGGNVSDEWMGKAVGIFPLIPCQNCIPCQQKKYEMCQHYSYLGSRCDGGYAEYVSVPEWNLMALPEGVSFEAAAMLEPMAVAVHAMRGLLGDESGWQDKVIAVWGLGTIGLLLVMFLRQAGAKHIYVIGNKDFQKEKVLGLGLEGNRYCDSREADGVAFLKEQTQGLGVDYFFEVVGKNEMVTSALNSVCPGGKVMLVGNPYSDMELPKDIYWKILRHQLTVKGTWNSSYTGEQTDDWHYVLMALAKGEIHPERLISHKFSMDKLLEGLAIMRDKSEDYVKIMMLNETDKA